MNHSVFSGTALFGLSMRTWLTPLALAVSALGSLPAQAVYVSPNGEGQVLLYPYYTTRNSSSGQNFFSALSVSNNTNQAKALNVRFLEGKNGKEVLLFNLFLAAQDMWTAALVRTEEGAKLVTADKSCTYPSLVPYAQSKDFVNYAYSGDGGGESLDRTREGSVEIIDMGDLKDPALISAITPVAGVAPCTASVLQQADTDALAGKGSSYVTVSSGGLSGSMSLVNVGDGLSYSMAATALDGFSATPLFTPAGSILPNLASVNPKVATVFDRGQAKHYGFAGTPRAVDPVSAVLMQQQLINEFNVETSTASGTDWVLAFPTKALLTNPSSVTVVARQPFESVWSGGQSFDSIAVTPYTREGQAATVTRVCFSSVQGPRAASDYGVRYATHVLRVGAASVLGAANASPIQTEPPVWSCEDAWDTRVQAGRVVLSFPRSIYQSEAHWLQSDTTPIPGYELAPASTFNGLPVLGFAVSNAVNGSLQVNGQSVLSSYGFTYPHRFHRVITTP